MHRLLRADTSGTGLGTTTAGRKQGGCRTHNQYGRQEAGGDAGLTTSTAGRKQGGGMPDSQPVQQAGGGGGGGRTHNQYGRQEAGGECRTHNQYGMQEAGVGGGAGLTTTTAGGREV